MHRAPRRAAPPDCIHCHERFGAPSRCPRDLHGTGRRAEGETNVVPAAIALETQAIVGLGVGVAIGFGVSLLIGLVKRQSARTQAASILEEAEKQAEEARRKGEGAAREELHRRREEFEEETRETRTELKLLEKRLVKREDALERKSEAITKREKYVDQLERDLSARTENLARRDRDLSEVLDKQKDALYHITSLSPQEAKAQLFERLERDLDREVSTVIDRKIQQTKERCDEEARVILSTAIQRCAVEHTTESVVSAIDLPTDEMKGRIIGREGRNIRAFEKATGVDVIVDDTPGVVVLSAFDSTRREMARQAMEELVADGRIHPSRIEEVVEKAKRKTEETIASIGKQVLFDMNIHTKNPKLAYLLGRLKYRTSYGQNVLQHSIEVAHLASIMASELKLDGQLAKRCGLLHDIGKAVDHELEGGHPEIGALLGKRYDEDPIVINAIAAHHEGEDPTSVYAVLIQAADGISAARPGARRETIEKYIRRLERLEAVANAFEGVDNAYAIQAGREVRVIVNGERVDDNRTAKLARDIAKEIEQELTYPGEIRVTVIRETRVVDYAR
ncbi:MAG: ribonuclease Y [Candidatus Brocadiae bacterium]|nr:ribonuclease Y [Candidatus Brocadiia bacterium]